VKALFKKEPRRDINPDEVVAMGAALYAYSLSADVLKEEAQDAAGDAFAVAVRGTEVARKVVEGLSELGGAIHDLPELRDRIGELLAEAGDDDAPTPKSFALLQPPDPNQDLTQLPELRRAAEDDLPTASSLPERRRPSNADLPQALHHLRGELSDLSEKAQDAIGRLAAEIDAEAEQEDDPLAKSLEELQGQLKTTVSEQLEGAREKSSEAASLLEQAEEHAKARRVDLVDITSLALGIASAADLFTVLIEHNTPVPTEKQRVFTTNQDGQTEVHIRVRQGRSQKASQNQLLGEFVLEGIQSAPRMEPKIEVIFGIDENGILSVAAKDQETGREQSIRVEDPLGLQTAKVKDLEKLAAAAEAASADD
jgi:molecular chaperone DnaK (HSP70)